jgi:hypothetical protein
MVWPPLARRWSLRKNPARFRVPAGGCRKGVQELICFTSGGRAGIVPNELKRRKPVNFKQRLIVGEPLLGTFLKTPHPHVMEVLATGGLDVICIDAEHARLTGRRSICA